MFVIYCGFLPIILFFGFIATLFIELPFGNLLKIMMEEVKGGSKKKIETKKEGSLLTN